MQSAHGDKRTTVISTIGISEVFFVDRPNRITIDEPRISNNIISYSYRVEGPWREAFRLDREFRIEYSIDVSKVPLGVAIVPLLANVLPMAWVYDAEIKASVCDADFYRCIPEVKRGYEDMYPMVRFGGNLDVARIEDNAGAREGAICLFSGGVDAFNTLIQHVDESPLLLTLRGADITLDDDGGWDNVVHHVESVSSDFEVGCTSVSSSFRSFLNEGLLGRKVAVSGDGWWHGFQHGIAIISHAAPLAYALNKEVIYIASSNTASTRREVTCASDPSIDNNVRFCGSRASHDGFELTRQDKVHNIVGYSRMTGTPIKLRVCWESSGGSNCCACEKCARTILEVIAEGGEPADYGFSFTSEQFDRLMRKLHYIELIHYPFYYHEIAASARENGASLPESARWVLSENLERICDNPRKRLIELFKKAIRKIGTVVVR